MPMMSQSLPVVETRRLPQFARRQASKSEAESMQAMSNVGAIRGLVFAFVFYLIVAAIGFGIYRLCHLL